MKQADYIKQIARFALANDNARLLDLLYRYVEYSQQNNRGKFASEILSIIKDTDRRNSLGKLREFRLNKEIESKADEFIIQTVMSSFTMKDLVCTPNIQEELEYFIKERKQVETLAKMDIPVSNKILLHGPSGCGKTLSAYVLAGELDRPLIIVNLGTVVSSKLGETSKNLTQIFKTADKEKAIVLLDEFDSLGKIRDYDQDHGEMKRVVNRSYEKSVIYWN
ncbi:ATP-binding protein [Prevotella sp. HJM029]|uniref:ATP-binding protein n=1 Tax=Prevotella sp. HJM029 TaxID=1433844 RepID=UPI0004B9C348|nr:ATP-binding protein [Prevotella sp. HJM029]